MIAVLSLANVITLGYVNAGLQPAIVQQELRLYFCAIPVGVYFIVWILASMYTIDRAYHRQTLRDIKCDSITIILSLTTLINRIILMTRTIGSSSQRTWTSRLTCWAADIKSLHSWRATCGIAKTP